MNSVVITKTVLLCLLLAFGILAMADSAQAQVGTDMPGAGPGPGQRDGLAEIELDKDRMPGRFEQGLALGSIIAMIAAIKYL